MLFQHRSLVALSRRRRPATVESLERRVFLSAGAPDPGFNGTGAVTMEFDGSVSRAAPLAVAPDGKIVAVANTDVSGNDLKVTLVRLNADGTPDASFDGDGRRLLGPVLPVGPTESNLPRVARVAVQGDGKILIAGFQIRASSPDGQLDHFVARLNADGTRDTTFGGGDGAYSLHGGSEISDLALLPGGKIVAVRGGEVIRLDAAGTPDRTFGGGDGIASLPVPAGADWIWSSTRLAADGAGRVTTAGWLVQGETPHGGIARLGADGSTDATFGGGGGLILPVFPTAPHDPLIAGSITAAPDGKVLLATGAGVVRLDAAGQFDPTFGGDGVAGGGPGEVLRGVSQVLPQPDGKLLVIAGFAGDAPFEGIGRLNADGSIDAGFGDGGAVNPGIAPSQIALQRDNKVIAVTVAPGFATTLTISRYLADPPADSAEVKGTAGNDRIRVTRDGGNLRTDVNGAVTTRPLAGLVRLIVDGGGGDDSIYVGAGLSLPATLHGGGGNDLLYVDATLPVGATFDGGDGDDTLHGGGGADDFSGGGGNDTADYSDQTAALSLSLDDVANDGPGRNDNVRGDVETLLGGSGDDVMLGNDGSNRLDGNGGDDRLFGLGGPSDVLVGGDGNDLLDGGAGDFDRLDGGAGDDRLLGGDGDLDQLVGGPGADYLSGGAGQHDTADYSGRTLPLQLGVGSVADDGEAGEHDNIRGDVEDLAGGDGNDVLRGTGAANILTGNGGNDRIYGLGGDDTLYGRDGDDLLDGGAGNDFLDGWLGTDTLDYSARANAVVVAIGVEVRGERIVSTFGGGEAGETDSGHEVEVVRGGAGNDLITGGDLPETLYGNGGNDTLRGGGGDDRLYGNGGNDTLDGEDGDDRSDAGSGTNLVVDAPGTARVIDGELVIVGTGADDAFAVTTGGAPSGPALVVRRSGRSDLTFPAASVRAVRLEGLGGNDTLRVGNADGSAAPDLPARLSGGGGSDALFGGPAADTLSGGYGNDTLDGGRGGDALLGGEGNDTVDYSRRTARVVVQLRSLTTDRDYEGGIPEGGGGEAGEGDSIRYDVEVAVGGSGNDELMAGGDTTVYGGPGDDYLRCGYDGFFVHIGNITLYGGPGNDTLHGDENATATAFGEAGDDRFEPHEYGGLGINGGAGFDTVDASSFFEYGFQFDTAGTSVEAIYGSEDDDVITGSDAAELIDGRAGNDRLAGGGGNDRIFGGGGDDWLDGGAGADRLSGGDGVDTLDYSSRTRGVHIGPGTAADDGEAGEHDNIATDIENFIGGAGDDYIVGTAADNKLTGNGGDDTLVGGLGKDQLRGNAGNDTLFSRDSIADFLDGGSGSADRAKRDDLLDFAQNVEGFLG